MKTIISISVVAMIVAGCSTFSTSQQDQRISYDTNGKIKEKTTITTKAGSSTLFDSKSNLAKWRATQTEKSQGAEVGGLGQESSGTNAVQILRIIVEGAK